MIWFVVGVVIGGTVGLFAAALLAANGRADDYDRAWMQGYKVHAARVNNELEWPER